MKSRLSEEKPQRLVSLDAYRGFVMLAMVSGGLAVASTLREHPEIVMVGSDAWRGMWDVLAYQGSHVAWLGCSFWDLIQPSFMFMVGVSMPFSYGKRREQGQSPVRLWGHVLWRSLILVALGVFLSSNSSRFTQTNFTFVNVLAQIGLGYSFVYLLLGRRLWVQLAAAAAILVGYWTFFYQYEMPSQERAQLVAYLEHLDETQEGGRPLDIDQFDGLAAHWNKHTNAAAAADRWLLNQFPRQEEAWRGRQFWINDGGYQTLNFIPSIATMLFGLMAGQMLRGGRENKQKFLWLLAAGAICFLVAMSLDTKIWPIQFDALSWSLCPTVKRIWTPTWAVFSAGWTFWMLAGFYAVIDVAGWRRWSFPLVVVGMNSIAMYVMAQLMKPWVRKTLQTHLRTLDETAGTSVLYYLASPHYPYADIWLSVCVLLFLWLICLWLYRQKIFIRI